MNQPPKPGIAIDVSTRHLPDQSDPANHRYVFAYTVTIRNDGNQPAQLISRHWIISDANNRIEEVKGLGVVGQQPLLQPGERFEYTSGCVLETAHGSMRGTFHLVDEEGAPFVVEIPEFTLALPRTLH